jgi:hypothetical protein
MLHIYCNSRTRMLQVSVPSVLSVFLDIYYKFVYLDVHMFHTSVVSVL